MEIAQWLAATGWIEPEEEGDIALDLTLSFPPCERNEFLPQARLLELCAEFGITDTDAMKHRLEDWARWRAAALASGASTEPDDLELLAYTYAHLEVTPHYPLGDSSQDGPYERGMKQLIKRAFLAGAAAPPRPPAPPMVEKEEKHDDETDTRGGSL